MITNDDDNYPPRPSIKDPLMCRLMRNTKTPSEWGRIAVKAEEDGKWGDAYHYWSAASSEHTRSHEKRKLYTEKSNKCLTKWRKDNV